MTNVLIFTYSSCSTSPFCGNQYSISYLGCEGKDTAPAVFLNDLCFNIITGLHDVLLGKNKTNPKALGDWGFDVLEDTTTTNKKPTVK